MKYIVEASIKYGKQFVELIENFDSLQEANKFAKEMATKHKGTSFYVRYPDNPNVIRGLDDHHYKYDPYFKMAVEFCHND